MPGRQRTRRSPDARREEILDATAGTLLDKGLSAMTVADVADRAGVAKGTVYLYFASKVEMLTALRARYTQEFLDTLGDALDRRGTEAFASRLDRFVDALVEFSLAHRELHHVLFHEAGVHVHEKRAFAQLWPILQGFVEAGMEAGAFARADPGLATDFLLHGLHGTLHPVLHDGRDTDRARTSIRLLARRLLAAPSAD